MAGEERPAVWVGHIAIGAQNIQKSADYWISLGMRQVVRNDRVVVLELRGGTHLVVLASDEPVAPGTPAPFDLMVEDIEVSHREYEKLGFEPSPLEVGQIHTSFTLTDPSGYRVTVNSSHVSDQPV